MFDKIKNLDEKLLNKCLIVSYSLNILFSIIFLIFFMCKDCGESILWGVPKKVFLIGGLIFLANIIIVIIKSIQLILLQKYFNNLGHLAIFNLVATISLGLALFVYAIPVVIVYIFGSVIILLIGIIHYFFSKGS